MREREDDARRRFAARVVEEEIRATAPAAVRQELLSRREHAERHELHLVVALPAPEHLVDRDQVVARGRGSSEEQQDDERGYGLQMSVS